MEAKCLNNDLNVREQQKKAVSKYKFWSHHKNQLVFKRETSMLQVQTITETSFPFFLRGTQNAYNLP